MDDLVCDVVVFGGGIAGLWGWAALRGAGFDAVLVESDELGGGQTLASQGILHGGQKYNLGGTSDSITERLRDQPGRWHEAMAGEAGPDLRSVRVLSDHQVMWPAGGLASKAAAAIGVRTLEGQVEPVTGADRPEVFNATGYRGQVYRLNETVLDTKSVVSALAGSGPAYRAETEGIETGDGRICQVVVRVPGGGDRVAVRAAGYVFAAGAGNEAATAALGFDQPATQRRPLKQVMVRGVPWKLYGHGLRASPKPRLTVTSHPVDGSDGHIWYLGGNVAEESVGKSDAGAVRFAAAELTAVFPGIDWDGFEFAIWDVDRAEPHTSSGRLPAEPVVEERGNAAVAWPTKLVLAPALGDRLVAWAEGRGIARSGARDGRQASPLPPATVGSYPWERATHWAKPSEA